MYIYYIIKFLQESFVMGINIDVSSGERLNLWAGWIHEGKSVRLSKDGQLKKMGVCNRVHHFFRPSKAADTRQKIVEAMTVAMRDTFNDKTANNDLVLPNSLIFLCDEILLSKKFTKKAREQLPRLDRYLVGVEILCGAERVGYQCPENEQFFDEDETKRDPRLLGTQIQFAKANPDFVDFMLNNNIYYQRARTNSAEELAFQEPDQLEPSIPFWEEDATVLYNWAAIKQYAAEENVWENAEEYTLKDYHMTKWGFLRQESFMWEEMRPITQVAAPDQPCFQVASYHPREDMTPGLFDEQGHSGMVFVDAEGYVYSCGFYCHPEEDFFKAQKTQRSAIRSPDLYEARVDINWQSMNRKNKNAPPPQLPVRWNDGVLQFNMLDDEEDAPCLLSILNAAKEVRRTDENYCGGSAPLFEEIAQKRAKLERLLNRNSNMKKIEKVKGDLHNLLVALNQLQVDSNATPIGLPTPMTATEKFDTMMRRVQDLQNKTRHALNTGDWGNGAIPYLMSESNCTHVSRYYFGQYGEVYLGMSKTGQVLNTRPGGEQYLPEVDQSPFSRWKWAVITTKTVILSRTMRFLSVTPVVATKCLGRGKVKAGMDNIEPRTGFFQSVRSIFNSVATPQDVREEGMAEQFEIPSVVRKVVHKIHRPSAAGIPMYHK